MLLMKNKFTRFLLALFLVYILWSILVNVLNIHKNIDDEAILPCLFLLPPLGIMGLGIVVAKIVESGIVVLVVKKIIARRRRKKDLKDGKPSP